MDGARTTKPYTTAKLGSCQSYLVAQIPEQWHLRIALEGAFHFIELELDHVFPPCGSTTLAPAVAGFAPLLIKSPGLRAVLVSNTATMAAGPERRDPSE